MKGNAPSGTRCTRRVSSNAILFIEMSSTPEVSDELKRLEILAKYSILDTPPEDVFDELTRLAAQICGVPSAMVTLVDKDRQWFKSRTNFGFSETARTHSFCAYAILEPLSLMVVPNALEDRRFADNPFVISDPSIRFYAGAPLVDPEGHALGTLCIIDYTPRTLTADQQQALRSLSRQAMTALELRRRTRALMDAEKIITQQDRAAQTLQASERLFHALAKAAPVGIFRTDASGDCIYVNQRWIEITGLPAERAHGKGWTQTLHADDRERVLATWYTAATTGAIFSAEYRFLRPDGGTTWVLGQALKDQTNTGQTIGYVGTITDITERKEAEDKLRRSEELLRQVLDSSEDCIHIVDLEGKIVWLNVGGQRVRGVADLSVVQGTDWAESWSLPGPIAAREALAKAKAGQPGIFTAQTQLEKADPQWWDVVVTPMVDAAGMPEKILSVSRDVTEHRRAERLLAWEKSALELIATSLPLREVLEGLMNGLEAHLSGALCSVLLLDEDGQHLRHGAAPALPESYCRAIDGAAIGPKAGSCGTAIYLGRQVMVGDIASDPLWADYRDFALSHELRACWSTPLRRSTGKVIGSFAIYYREPRIAGAHELELIDRATHIVSIAIERKQAEDALRQSSERLQLVARATNDAVWDWDLATNKLWWNEGFQTLFGYPPDEVEPGLESWTTRLHPNDAVRVKEEINQIIQNGGVSWKDEYRFRRRDGTYANIFDRGYVIHDAAGKAIRMIGAMVDISERKRTEEALRASEERFRQLAENIKEVFWVTDTAKNQVLYISPAYSTIWGRTCESLYESSQRWSETIHPEDRLQVLEAAKTKQKAGDYDETYRILRPDGAVRWIRDRAYPVRSAEGDVYRIVGIAEDITDRKTMEAQFLRAQRTETVGRLAGGVAHDINNILAPIMMASSLLRMGMDPVETEKTLSMIETSAQRGADVVKQLLLFRRGLEGQRSVVRLPELVQEIAKIVQKTFLKNIQLSVTAPEESWPVVGDATQLHQVLLNLCVNARDAMPDGGELTLDVQNCELDTKGVGENPEARPGCYVRLTVTDTGVGISSEILGQIFDPFFTTKPIGQGTGLGLSTVLGIVKSHGGFLQVKSDLGQGSTFDVYLPASPGLVQPDPAPLAPVLPAGQGEMILIVDDEEHIRETLCRTLCLHGYQVQSAKDGAEAIDLFTKHANDIKLVLSDVDMPSMDGPTLIGLLRKKNPQLKVIISSGIAGSTLSHSRTAELNASGLTTLLAKPYTSEKILCVIRDLLASVNKKHTALSSSD